MARARAAQPELVSRLVDEALAVLPDWLVGAPAPYLLDTCAGRNSFAQALSRRMNTLTTRSVDLAPPADAWGCVEPVDFFSLPAPLVPPGAPVLVGFNPPFGYRSGLARKFVLAVIRRLPQPHCVAWLVPASLRVALRDAYAVLHERLLPHAPHFATPDGTPLSHAVLFFVGVRDPAHAGPARSRAPVQYPFTMRQNHHAHILPEHVLIVRRVGVNAGRQCFVRCDGERWAMRFRDAWHAPTSDFNGRAVDGGGFVKITLAPDLHERLVASQVATGVEPAQALSLALMRVAECLCARGSELHDAIAYKHPPQVRQDDLSRALLAAVESVLAR